MAIKHAFVSSVTDGNDATQVQPSNWNAGHTIDTPTALLSSDGVLTGTDASGLLTLNGVKATAKYQHIRRNSGNTAFEAALIDYLKTPSGISTSDIGVLLGTDDGSGNTLVTGNSATSALQFFRRKGNVSSKSYEFADFDFRRASDHNFTGVSIAVSLTSGITNTVTLPYGILGLAGANTKHYIRINDTVGTSETVLINGGTSTSGVVGTLSFKCAYAHTSGNWTLESCTKGAAEAQWTLTTNGGIVELPAGTNLFKGPFQARAIPVWLRGQGKMSTQISVDTASFPSTIDGTTVTGVLNYATGQGLWEEAGEISDLTIKFVQPNSTNPAAMTTYCPGIYAFGVNHFRVSRVNIAAAYDGITATNLSGIEIKEVGLSFFHYGISVDVCLDLTLISRVIIWPFELTTNQTTAFLAAANHNIGFYIGHADALIMEKCSTLCTGYTADFHLGTDNYATTGFISNCWFDGTGNINFGTCSIQLNNVHMGVADSYASIAGIHVVNAEVKLNNVNLLHLGTSATTLIKFNPTSNYSTSDGINPSAMGVPSLMVSNSRFQMYATDIPVCQIASLAGLTKVVKAKFNNCLVEKSAGVVYATSIFKHVATAGGGGEILYSVNNCEVSEVGGGSGAFCDLATDVLHNFQGNNGGGYSFTLAGTANTVFRNNYNFLLNTHLFQESIRVLNGTATASAGAATLAKQAGKITTEALSTAAAATYTLTLTNTKIAATSFVFASVCYGTATQGTPQVVSITPSANTVVIIIKNIHATLAFDGTLKISFFTLPT